MKTILCNLIIALFSVSALANITANQEFILNKQMGGPAQEVQLGTLINKTKAVLIARYSYAVQGGSTAADISLLTDLKNTKSYAVLPAKAVVTNVWIDPSSAVTAAGSATVAIKAVGAGDLLGATAKAAFSGYIQGVPTGATTTFVTLTTAKTVKATVATSPLTAGKFDVVIEYIIGN
jgi:hypothetical protein